MLVDADNYFLAVRHAIRGAQHSIFILAWDIDSRMRLVPAGAKDGFPEELGDFLHAVVASRPDLYAYVLNWDFAMLYAIEREWLPVYKLGWRTHQRLAFRMDGRHPVGASHHQKVIVVDDTIAFVGGLDLTRARWDTPQHQVHDPRRLDAGGKSYGPFHDVQAMVDGNAAQALGALCRQRWHKAVGRLPLPALKAFKPTQDLWPPTVGPDLLDVDVGISRTEPAFGTQAGVNELRSLYLDAIAVARKWLFFENQYFTSGLIAQALAARLEAPDGPEVLVISPQSQSGWLEEATMGVLRARLQRRLRLADHDDRYRLVCPLLPNQAAACLNVHSKVFAADDRLFSIGSANLSNRSLACDTECNLSIEACGSPARAARIAEGIARLRSRLLAEHLDQPVARVMDEVRASGSLLASIHTLGCHARHLRRFEPLAAPELDALIPEQALFDPERPIEPDQLLAQLVPEEYRAPVPKRLGGLGLLALLLLGLALTWRFTPLAETLNLASLVRFAREIEALPFTPVAIVLAFVLAGLVLVPVTLLIAVTGIVFGLMPGALYAMGGALLSALANYGVGAWLGRDTVRQMLGGRLNRLSRRIAQRGILAMIIIRLLPVAPFGVVNLVAGAAHIRLRDYLIGTAIGLLPGILLTTTFAHHLTQVIRRPGTRSIAVLVIVVLLLIGLTLWTRRILARSGDDKQS